MSISKYYGTVTTIINNHINSYKAMGLISATVCEYTMTCTYSVFK